MINFLKNHINKKARALADVLSHSSRQRDLSYIRQLETENDYLRNKLAHYNLEEEPARFWQQFFEAHNKIRVLKPGNKIELCLHAKHVELVKATAVHHPKHKGLKEYYVVVNVHRGDRFTQYVLYGQKSYWHLNTEEGKYISSYCEGDLKLIHEYFEFFDSYNFFPVTGHKDD